MIVADSTKLMLSQSEFRDICLKSPFNLSPNCLSFVCYLDKNLGIEHCHFLWQFREGLIMEGTKGIDMWPMCIWFSNLTKTCTRFPTVGLVNFNLCVIQGQVVFRSLVLKMCSKCAQNLLEWNSLDKLPWGQVTELSPLTLWPSLCILSQPNVPNSKRISASVLHVSVLG